MFGLLNDLRSGLRTLRRDPGYAGMIVITLAICIGADTAVFSVVDSVLLQPLPVPDSDRIVLMANHYPNSGAGENLMSSGGDYIDRLSGVTAFGEQALFQVIGRTLDFDGRAERSLGMEATPSLFRLLQITRHPHGQVFLDTRGFVEHTHQQQTEEYRAARGENLKLGEAEIHFGKPKAY